MERNDQRSKIYVNHDYVKVNREYALDIKSKFDEYDKFRKERYEEFVRDNHDNAWFSRKGDESGRLVHLEIPNNSNIVILNCYYNCKCLFAYPIEFNMNFDEFKRILSKQYHFYKTCSLLKYGIKD